MKKTKLDMSIHTRMVGANLVLGFLHYVPVGSATDILENILAPPLQGQVSTSTN